MTGLNGRDSGEGGCWEGGAGPLYATTYLLNETQRNRNITNEEGRNWVGREKMEQIARKKQKDLEGKSVLRSYLGTFPLGGQPE